MHKCKMKPKTMFSCFIHLLKIKYTCIYIYMYICRGEGGDKNIFNNFENNLQMENYVQKSTYLNIFRYFPFL